MSSDVQTNTHAAPIRAVLMPSRVSAANNEPNEGGKSVPVEDFNDVCVCMCVLVYFLCSSRTPQPMGFTFFGQRAGRKGSVENRLNPNWFADSSNSV